VRYYYVGIDPGKRCGWASLSPDGGYRSSGTWELDNRRGDGGGMRYVRFERLFSELFLSHPGPIVVGYELVRPYGSGDSMMSYYGITTRLMAFCDEHDIPYTGVPVHVIKSTATGKGNADKDAVRRAALERWPTLERVARNGITYDEADALWIAEAVRLGRA
jgi:Holliday junction resolvasome RuvABC endonuclease subunit